jgi:hypothetical protein
MHRSGETSDTLVALHALMLNREWDRYWEQAQGQPALLAAGA